MTGTGAVIASFGWVESSSADVSIKIHKRVKTLISESRGTNQLTGADFTYSLARTGIQFQNGLNVAPL